MRTKLIERYLSIHNQEPPIDLSQCYLIQKIKLYVKTYNQVHPTTPIELPVVSDMGWCVGLTSVWGYLKAGHGKEGSEAGQIDEKWFFTQLNDIARLSAEELVAGEHSEQLSIEKLIGYINLLQGKGEIREKFLFDSAQTELNQSLGLGVQYSVGTLLKTKDDIKLLMEQCQLFPNKFIRLSTDLHSVGLYYDEASKKFHLYEPNQAVGVDTEEKSLSTSEHGAMARVEDIDNPMKHINLQEYKSYTHKEKEQMKKILNKANCFHRLTRLIIPVAENDLNAKAGHFIAQWVIDPEKITLDEFLEQAKKIVTPGEFPLTQSSSSSISASESNVLKENLLSFKSLWLALKKIDCPPLQIMNYSLAL